jgi:uncharacterized repeat protein (TIGR03803 family)
MICFHCNSRLSILKTLAVAAFVTVIAAMTLAFAPAAQAQTYGVIYNFTGSPSDGAGPNAELIQDEAGNWYGTTIDGGANVAGVIFKLDPGGVETILYSFTGGADSGFPETGLFRDPTGNLYGTTGGANFGVGGTVFELDTNNVLTTLYTFKGGTDGAQPWFKPASVNGELHGTTFSGGDSKCNCGVIFNVTKGGRETVLHRFTGGADGGIPQALIRDSAGNLYGVAGIGGIGGGTVFKLDTAGVFTVLYSFTGGADGGFPVGRLVRDTNGIIHGVTETGGDPTCQCGVVFRLDADGKETVLHNFFGFGGGYGPFDAGLLDVGGVLYGTTAYGGDRDCVPTTNFSASTGCGLVFQIGKTGQYTVLHRFTGPTGDGRTPAVGELTLGEDGSIYGATLNGGDGTSCSDGETLGCGTIFKFTP